MKVNALVIIKNIAVFLLLCYVNMQLPNKLFAAKDVSDIIAYLILPFFMLAYPIARMHLLRTKITPKEKETKK